MSLLIEGTTVCPLCGRVIESANEAQSFPAFAWDDLDPLWIFNDASVHAACLEADERADTLAAVLNEMQASTGPDRRTCVVCKQEITDPDDYLLLPRLAVDRGDPLFEYNYTHLHRSHVKDWDNAAEVIRLLQIKTGTSAAPYLEQLIRELVAPRPRRACPRSPRRGGGCRAQGTMTDVRNILVAVLAGDVRCAEELTQQTHESIAEAATRIGRLRLTRAALHRAVSAWHTGVLDDHQIQAWASFLRCGFVAGGDGPITPVTIEFDDAHEDLLVDVLSRLDELGDLVDGVVSRDERLEILKKLSG